MVLLRNKGTRKAAAPRAARRHFGFRRLIGFMGRAYRVRPFPVNAPRLTHARRRCYDGAMTTQPARRRDDDQTFLV